MAYVTENTSMYISRNLEFEKEWGIVPDKVTIDFRMKTLPSNNPTQGILRIEITAMYRENLHGILITEENMWGCMDVDYPVAETPVEFFNWFVNNRDRIQRAKKRAFHGCVIIEVDKNIHFVLGSSYKRPIGA